jgi:energy-coupling factor transporter ATP-binding protein EcfA2
VSISPLRRLTHPPFCSRAQPYTSHPRRRVPQCFAEIPAIFSSKRTAGRQLASGFYGPLSYVVSMVVVGLPLGLASSLAFGAIMYAMGGFSPGAAQWGTFLGVVAGFDLATSTLFRLFALLAPVEELAQAAGGVSMGIFLIFNGLAVSFELVPKYMLPVLYLSPFSWAARALMVNEMESGGFYAEPVDPSAPAGTVPTRGAAYLDIFGFDAGDGWVYGGGMGVLFGYALIFGPLMSTWAVSRLRPPTPPGSTRISDAEFFAAAAASAAAATPRASSSTPGSAAITPSPSSGSLHTATAAAEPADAAAVTVVDVVPSPAPVTDASPSLALPFVPTTLTFKDITYSVTVKAASGDGDAGSTTKKTLLRGVSGFVTPGSMVALMGASGAGKTTLLDVLAGRKTTGTVGGQIRLNGVPATPASFSAVAGFAQQTDVNADYATVAEALQFAAALRLPASATPEARAAHVADVMAQLELTPLAHRRTGALAPGERKRLTIAVELAANPSVLFLDGECVAGSGWGGGT